MDYYSSGISRLIEELGKLPGVGPSRHSAWLFILLICRRRRWIAWLLV